MTNIFKSFKDAIYLMKNIPECSLVYKNDLFILSHRCASSAIRSAIICLNGECTYDYYAANDSSINYGWGLRWNNYDKTVDMIKSGKYNVFMFFREPISYFCSLSNIWNISDVNLLIAIIQQNKNADYLNQHSHIISQYDRMQLFKQHGDINVMNVKNIKNFFKNRYDFDFIPKHISKHKFITQDTISQVQMMQLKQIYKDDITFYNTIK